MAKCVSDCRLCGEHRRLHESHIVPRFVFKWLKESSFSGIRSNKAPSLRVQDGPKLSLLCTRCEQLFSVWEKRFSEEIFRPVHEGDSQRELYGYGEWGLKFAASVSWRSYWFFAEFGFPDHFSCEQVALAKEAEKSWRRYLRSQQPHPGPFEQHMIIVDRIESHDTPGMSPFINRYLTRSLDLDIAASERSAFLYTKMCRIVLLGFFQVPRPRQYKGTKIHLKRGSAGGDIELPATILDFWNEKANLAAGMQSQMSKRQRTKIDEQILSRPEEFADTEVFRAIDADVALFGQRAFEIPRTDESE